MAKHALVIVENALLDALLLNQTAREKFGGCLNELAAAPTVEKCGQCNNTATKTAAAYDKAKSCFALMSDALRQEFKRFLDADQVWIVCNIGGKTRTFTF
jgi:hypothetical protein